MAYSKRTRPNASYVASGMTGSNFYDYVLRTFKRTDKSTEFYEALNDIITDIKLRFKSEDFQEETYTSDLDTAEEFYLNLPTDFKHLIGDVKILEANRTYPPLTKLSKAGYDRFYPYPNDSSPDTGRPTHYCIYAGKIYFAPAVDRASVYTVEFNYTTEAMTALTSSSYIPFTDFNRLLPKYGVLYLLYLDLGFDEEASKFKVLYEAELQKVEKSQRDNESFPIITRFNDL